MTYSVFIKNMVSSQCKSAVELVFKKHNLHPRDVLLGQVILNNEPSKTEIKYLKLNLEELGYELITDNAGRISTKVKSVLLDLVDSKALSLDITISEYLTQHLPYEYHYLSNLFSSIEKKSIEKYFISLKIEKAKTLIKEGKLNSSEIAYRLGYSSPAHFTNQFKQVTDMTPTIFKKLNN